jgi:hypothetical protein
MEPVRWSRLRWRLRGAWLWPAFAALTVLDAVLLHVRPIQGTRIDVVPALLAAGFANLVIVAVGAPVAGLLLRRVRPDLPKVVAADTAGALLLVSLTVTFAVAGLVHHGAVAREHRAAERAAALARRFASQAAPPAVQRSVAAADTIRVDPGRVYRSCMPESADRAWCVVVHLDADPPRIVYDGHEPNASWGGEVGG